MSRAGRGGRPKPAHRPAGPGSLAAPAEALARPGQQRGATRVGAVDALRGIAIVAMVVYHFVFDLRFFGVVRADFENDPFLKPPDDCWPDYAVF